MHALTCISWRGVLLRTGLLASVVITPVVQAATLETGTAAGSSSVLRWGDGVLHEAQGQRVRPVKTKHPVLLPTRVPAHIEPSITMLQLAWQAYQAGEYDLARTRYEQVMDGDHNVDVQLGLAAIAVQQHRNEFAIRHYQQVLMLEPRNTTALAALAMLAGERHAPEMEAKILQQLAMQPSAALQFSLGNLYADQQRWREAEAAYFESYQADNRNADYAYNLAVSLDYLRLYSAAVTYYQKARDALPASGGHIDALRLNKRIQQLQEVVSQSR
ncbi:tetratricopeptide repeat protein [Sulfuriferula thiophila]|uniref:tetratricopeptide repeat protein n=1 Tax=Sulfuriferula thiophila TaxID=1781211 RepID=UPI000F60AB78|nr:hypothetical protein [Sulfuriferula thiophila]